MIIFVYIHFSEIKIMVFKKILLKLSIILIFSISILTILIYGITKVENRLKPLSNINLDQLTEYYYDVDIHSLTLNRTGQVEIGQALEIEINYSINCSDYYIITQNWVDLLTEPLNRTNLIYPAVNHKYNETIYIDPERFDPDFNKNYSAMSNIEVLAMNGSTFGKTAISQEKIKILKASLECTLLEEPPELIFSNEKLNFTCKFYNEHNDEFVLRNELVNVKLYDFQFNLIQNISKLTDNEGNLNIFLDFDLGVPGTYRLYLNTNDLVDYEDFSFSKTFNILDINDSFCITANNESELYVATNFDLRTTKICLESSYGGNFKWNSSFEEKYFEMQNSSLTFKSNFINPKNSGVYKFDIWGNLTDYNKIIQFPVYFKFLKRNLKIINSSFLLNNENEIEIFLKFLDNTSQILENYDFITELYLKVQDNWTKICSMANNMGIINSKVKINEFIHLLNNSIEIKLNSNSTSYIFKEIQYDYYIPNILINYVNPTKSLTNNIINLQVFDKNGNIFSNQTLKIYVNDAFYEKIQTDQLGNSSFNIFISNYYRFISIKIIFDENDCYIPYVHRLIIYIIPNEFNLIISNFGLISSVFLVLPFCFVMIKRQKNKNKMEDIKI